MSYLLTVTNERGDVVGRLALPGPNADYPPARHLMAMLVRHLPRRLREWVLARTARVYRGFALGGQLPRPRAECLADVDQLLEDVRRRPSYVDAAREVC